MKRVTSMKCKKSRKIIDSQLMRLDEIILRIFSEEVGYTFNAKFKYLVIFIQRRKAKVPLRHISHVK